MHGREGARSGRRRAGTRRRSRRGCHADHVGRWDSRLREHDQPQNGTFTVVEGATDSGKALPLTGVTVSGRCDTVPSPFGGVPDGIVAVAVVRAASGTTMDVFKNGNPVGQTSAVVGGFGAPPGMTTGGAGTADTILTSNGATATITVGGYGDPTSRTCKFLWQGVEAAN